ncbi:hypothetical protein CcCBS67573_g02549 [Chytriomyces confervae]|uniref:DNA helicase n=1 Tax=Chytriomyces confervae TaxID=246404 RepID=A0A507FIN6_9FUNG|nr:hypothetical protein CcCBS67573_g02549 [Chytriomyces confervae]
MKRRSGGGVLTERNLMDAHTDPASTHPTSIPSTTATSGSCASQQDTLIKAAFKSAVTLSLFAISTRHGRGHGMDLDIQRDERKALNKDDDASSETVSVSVAATSISLACEGETQRDNVLRTVAAVFTCGGDTASSESSESIPPFILKSVTWTNGHLVFEYTLDKTSATAKLLAKRRKSNKTRKTSKICAPVALSAADISVSVARAVSVFGLALDVFNAQCPGNVYSQCPDDVYTHPPLPSNEDIQPGTNVSLSLSQLLETVTKWPFYRNQLECTEKRLHRIVEPRPFVHGSLDVALSNELASALLETSNVSRLYSHQASAINYIQAGSHVMVSTSTASGKSLIYQIPVIQNLEQDLEARALFIFPTKALSQDQKRSLTTLMQCHETLSQHLFENEHWIATYDGDTPTRTETTRYTGGKPVAKKSLRTRIRETSRVVFTNFDMLHKTFVGHRNWVAFFRNLKIVVVDELHYYGGSFGAHCAYVMRRLKRICSFYGNESVQFVCCSATISNAVEHMKSFFDIEHAELVDVDGSSSGRKHHLIWNPPPLITPFANNPKRELDAENQETTTIDPPADKDKTQLPKPLIERVPSLQEAGKMACLFLRHGIRFLCFTKTRNACELLLKEIHTMIEEACDSGADKVMAYRGGYSVQERRDIEGRMFRGELLGIVATNALELGIDIGALDVVIHLGFPHSVASYRQQAGRAGRRNADSASILIADGFSKIDQFYVENPDALFEGQPDTIQLNFSNSLITEQHAQCTAAEIPITPPDLSQFLAAAVGTSSQALETAEDLGEEVVVDILKNPERFLQWDATHCVYFSAQRYDGNPARTFQIRSSAADGPGDEGAAKEYRVIDVETNRDIESVDWNRAFFTLYDGAIFIHQGQSFLILDVHHERKVARAKKTTATYITSIKDYNLVDPQSIQQTKCLLIQPSHSAHDQRIHFGDLKVTTVSNGYHILNAATKKRVDTIDTGSDINRVSHSARGIWMEDVARERVVALLRGLNLDVAGSVHCAGHALLKAIKRVDTGGACVLGCFCLGMVQSGPKRIAIYSPPFSHTRVASNALIQKSFLLSGKIVKEAIQLLESCACDACCVDCGYIWDCTSANQTLDRKGGIQVLKSFLN